MFVVHLGTTVNTEFALVNERGNIVERKTATAQIPSTEDAAAWDALRHQAMALRDQLQNQAAPPPVPALPAASAVEEPS